MTAAEESLVVPDCLLIPAGQAVALAEVVVEHRSRLNDGAGLVFRRCFVERAYGIELVAEGQMLACFWVGGLCKWIRGPGGISADRTGERHCDDRYHECLNHESHVSLLPQ